MKCEACQQVLEDYVDGELTVKRAAEVDAHLAGCAACATALAELQQEQAIYARYERGIEVTPALWAGVEARLKAERATAPDVSTSKGRRWLMGLFTMPHISPAFAAALVVLAIGVTVAVMSYLQSRNVSNGNLPEVASQQTDNGNANTREATSAPPDSNGPNKGLAKKENPENKPGEDKQPVKVLKPALPKQLQASNSKPQSPPDPMKLVREAEQKYMAAIAIMAQDVNRHRSQIDPAVLARFDSALADIDRTIQEARQVVRRNPDDPVALQYLLAAYAKKVDTLRAMTLD